MNIKRIEYNDLGEMNIKEHNSNFAYQEKLKADLLACKYVKNVLYSYDKRNKHKYKNDYILSCDKNMSKKFFITFETITDMVKFIEINKYKNLYEIITKDIVKPYFDIDYKNKHTTKANIKKFIKELTIEFNNFFIASIKEDDFLIYTKHHIDDKDKIISIHIIINGVMISKVNNLTFVKMMNKKRSGIKKTINSSFDIAVYDTNKNFSLPYQNKLGQIGKNTLKSNIFFEPFDDDEKHNNIKSYLINNTIECKYTDCKSNENIGEINEIENKIIEQHNREIINEDNKITKQEANKNLQVFNLDKHNIINTLIDNLPSEFYKSGCDNWTLITRQLFFNRCTNYDDWIEYSAKQSTYSNDENITWTIKQDDKYISTNLQKYLNLINNSFTLNKNGITTKYLWDFNNYFYDELKAWICKISNITKITLDKIILNNKEAVKTNQKSIEKIELGNGYAYYIKKELIINELHNKTFHFGYDTGFNKQYGIDDTIFKTINRDEIIKTTEQFLNGENKLCGFKMLWGTGKTHYAVSTINKWRIDKNTENSMRIQEQMDKGLFKKKRTSTNLKMIFVTENNTLNAETTAKFDGVSHLDPTIENYGEYEVVITSMESLHKILKTCSWFDIVVFDEYESVINHFLSTTYKTAGTTPFEVSKLFKKLVADATKIVCLDCDLSIKRMDLIKNVIDEDNEIDTKNSRVELYNCDFNNWANYDYNLHLNLNKMKTEMEDKIYNHNKKIIFASTSKTEAMGVYRRIIELNTLRDGKKNVLMFTRNGANNDDGITYVYNGINYSTEIMTNLITKQTKCNNDLNKYAFKITIDELTDDERKTIDDIKNELDTINKAIKMGKYTKLPRDKIIENLEQIIIDLKIDILIYSPTIKCGISIGNDESNKLFDIVYGYATNGSITAREFLQMLHRCRHLTDKQINIHVKTGIKKITNKITDNIVINYIKNHQLLKIEVDEWYTKLTKYYDIDEFYNKILISTFGEKIDSEKNYAQELMGRLRFNHNINVNIIPKYEEEDIDNINKKYQSKSTEYSNENTRNLMRVNKINDTRFDKISKKQNENKTSEENMEEHKFKTMNSMRNNFSNSKMILELPKPNQYVSHLKDELYYSGIFTNYLTDTLDKTFFYVPSKKEREKAKMRILNTKIMRGFPAIDEPILYGMENTTPHNKIIRKDYDKDHMIKHSLNIGMIHSKKLIKTIHRLNSNILTEYTDADELNDINNISISDMETNKLHIIKHILKILKIDRMELVYDRYITTNQKWKELFNENSDFIQLQFNKYVKGMDIKKLDTDKYINISNYNSKNRVQYRFVKDNIIELLNYIGISTFHYLKCGNKTKNNTEKDTNFIIIQYGLQDKYINNFMCMELRRNIAVNRTFINTYYDTIKNDIYYFINKKHMLLNETIKEDVLQHNLRISKKTRFIKCDTQFYTSYGSKTSCIKKKRCILNLTWNTKTNLPNSIEIPHHIFSKTYTKNKDNEVINLCLTDDKNNNKLYKHYKKNDEQRNKDIADYINSNFNTSIQPNFIYEDVNKSKNDISYYKYESIEWTLNKDASYDKSSIYKYTTNEDKTLKEDDEDKTLKEDDENKQPQHPQELKEFVRDCINKIIDVIVVKHDFKKMLHENINNKNAIIDVENCISTGTMKPNSNDIFNNIIRPNIKPKYVKPEQPIKPFNKCMISVN